MAEQRTELGIDACAQALQQLIKKWRNEQHYYAARADATLERNYDPSGITNQAISNAAKRHADDLAALLASAVPAPALPPKRAPVPSAVDLFDVALRGANTALPVLITMLKKVGLRKGMVVADEIQGNVACALKVLRERRSEIAEAVPAPPPVEPEIGGLSIVRQAEIHIANNGWGKDDRAVSLLKKLVGYIRTLQAVPASPEKENRAVEALKDYAEDLRSMTWLTSVSAGEMNTRDRCLADVLDKIAEEWERASPVPEAPHEPDEEMVPHQFHPRHPGSDEEEAWCVECEYHRDHEIHQTEAPASREQEQS